jgi:hypothetical protein
MIRRSRVIRVVPAPPISPVRILPIRVALAGAGRSRWPTGARGAGCARPRRRWPGHDAFPFAGGKRCRVPATAATAAGRDAQAG